MNSYQKYNGVIAFCVALIIIIVGGVFLIKPKVEELTTLKASVEEKTATQKDLYEKLTIVQSKIKKIKNSISSSQKKVYSPVEADLGNETLFFTLYNDVIEMLHANSIKIKSIDYTYNPSTDSFVKFGKDVYFVCDLKMDLVSNYVNLGKLIQDLYQYPYYIKINEIDVKPYEKDKKILLSNVSIRLYAHTEPEDVSTSDDSSVPTPPLDGATSELPQ